MKGRMMWFGHLIIVGTKIAAIIERKLRRGRSKQSHKINYVGYMKNIVQRFEGYLFGKIINYSKIYMNVLVLFRRSLAKSETSAISFLAICTSAEIYRKPVM